MGYLDNDTLSVVKDVTNKLNIELVLLSPNICIKEVDDLQDEFNYSKAANKHLSTKERKEKRLSVLIENLDKSNLDIAKEISILEPNTNIATLETWVSRNRLKV